MKKGGVHDTPPQRYVATKYGEILDETGGLLALAGCESVGDVQAIPRVQAFTSKLSTARRAKPSARLKLSRQKASCGRAGKTSMLQEDPCYPGIRYVRSRRFRAPRGHGACPGRRTGVRAPTQEQWEHSINSLTAANAARAESGSLLAIFAASMTPLPPAQYLLNPEWKPKMTNMEMRQDLVKFQLHKLLNITSIIRELGLVNSNNQVLCLQE